MAYQSDKENYPIIGVKRYCRGHIIWVSFAFTGGWPSGEEGIRKWDYGKEEFWKTILQLI
jgi:hypothetical protein